MKNNPKEYRETMHVIKFMQFLLDNLSEEELSLLPHDTNGFIDVHSLLFDSKLYGQFIQKQYMKHSRIGREEFQDC